MDCEISGRVCFQVSNVTFRIWKFYICLICLMHTSRTLTITYLFLNLNTIFCIMLPKIVYLLISLWLHSNLLFYLFDRYGYLLSIFFIERFSKIFEVIHLSHWTIVVFGPFWSTIRSTIFHLYSTANVSMSNLGKVIYQHITSELEVLIYD